MDAPLSAPEIAELLIATSLETRDIARVSVDERGWVDGHKITGEALRFALTSRSAFHVEKLERPWVVANFVGDRGGKRWTVRVVQPVY